MGRHCWDFSQDFCFRSFSLNGLPGLSNPDDHFEVVVRRLGLLSGIFLEPLLVGLGRMISVLLSLANPTR